MSPLEKKFTWLWVHVVKGPTDVVLQHKFCSTRRWQFDFAHVPTRVAIEIEGGTGFVKSKTGKSIRGHHVNQDGYANDCEKYNSAALLGWRVFRLTSKMVTADQLEIIARFIRVQPVIN